MHVEKLAMSEFLRLCLQSVLQNSPSSKKGKITHCLGIRNDFTTIKSTWLFLRKELHAEDAVHALRSLITQRCETTKLDMSCHNRIETEQCLHGISFVHFRLSPVGSASQIMRRAIYNSSSPLRLLAITPAKATPHIALMMTSTDDSQLRQFRLRAVRAHKSILSTKPNVLKNTLCVSKTIDTEHCFKGCSRLYRLLCGHVIHTDQPTICNITCEKPVINFAPFLCTLCERWKMVQAKKVKRRSAHVADLILPDFPKVDQSHVQYIVRARQCDVVYPLPTGDVFVPFTTEDIAVVRVLEQRRLTEIVYETIPSVGAEAHGPSDLIV